jgi:galactokinase
LSPIAGMAELVPQLHSIEEVYAEASGSQSIAPEHKTRWNALISAFSDAYGSKPDFVARSPGRVNIIGEHVDYSLYNVLPMAVTVDALVAVKASTKEKPTVKIADLHPDRYPSSEFAIPLDGDIEIDPKKHEWTNYFKAGLRGALQFLRSNEAGPFRPASLEIIVDGNVPPGGGLSSSAALVCASALAVMKANGHDVSKQDLLDLAIVSERAVGVFAGGMDQAASIFSKRGYLLYCQFYPSFRAEHIPVPPSEPEIAFLIAQSFVTSDKATTAPKHYNLRVVEVTLAALVLAKLHDAVLTPDDSSLGFSLRGFQEEYMKKSGGLGRPLEQQVDAMIEVAELKLTEHEGYTRDNISKILGISVETLESEYMSKFPVQAETFQLRQRALHVYQEARRVLDFKRILSHTDKLTHDILLNLGELMNETQASCRDIYDCSCPEINEICRIARKAGTYGSRLTGLPAPTIQHNSNSKSC